MSVAARRAGAVAAQEGVVDPVLEDDVVPLIDEGIAAILPDLTTILHSPEERRAIEMAQGRAHRRPRSRRQPQ